WSNFTLWKRKKADCNSRLFFWHATLNEAARLQEKRAADRPPVVSAADGLVVIHQDLGNLGTGELGRRCHALAQHLPHLGAGQRDEVFRGVVRRFAHHHDAAQFLRKRSVVGAEQLNQQRALRYFFVEDGL